MKLKHNKRRNTAFLFESLLREATRSVLDENEERKKTVLSIIKKFFNKNNLLAKELEIYKSLYESRDLDERVAEKVLNEAKRVYFSLDQAQIYDEQSALISTVNKTLSKNVFSNFVPNFKSLATLSQIFNDNLSIKNRVLLEQKVIKSISKTSGDGVSNMKHVDNLVFKTFVKNFNKTYAGSLLEEQKNLISSFISSFSDNGIEMKIFLNEEVGRLRRVLQESLFIEEVKEDQEMANKTKEIIELLEDIRNHQIDKDVVLRVLKIQNLAKEIQN